MVEASEEGDRSARRTGGLLTVAPARPVRPDDPLAHLVAEQDHASAADRGQRACLPLNRGPTSTSISMNATLPGLWRHPDCTSVGQIGLFLGTGMYMRRPNPWFFGVPATQDFGTMMQGDCHV